MIAKIALEAMKGPERSSLFEDDGVIEANPISFLERSAILALCKIMCVSKEICTKYIGLIFDLMSSP